MSKLDKIKKNTQKRAIPKVWLEDINFDFEKSEDSPLGPHIHIVSQAASLHDEPLLLKSRGKELTEEEISILEKVRKTQTKKEELMSEDVVKGLEAKIDALLKANEEAVAKSLALEKQLKTEEVKKELKDFSFKNEDEIAKILTDLEGKDEILKAFSFLKEQIKEEVGETELQKQMSESAGAEGDAEVVEKNMNTQLKEIRGLK